MPLRPSSNIPLSTRSLIVLLVIMAVAFALRIYKLDAHGVYLDEKFTLVASQGVVQEGSNQHDVFFTPGKPYFTPKEFHKPKRLADYDEAIARSDISNSPAYTGLLSLWIRVFGISDFSVRFLSVLFSMGTVWLIFLLARRYTGSVRVGLISAAVAATEPFFVAYSHVARAYSMTIFVSLLATWLFLRILDRLSDPTRTGERNVFLANKGLWGLYAGYGIAYAVSILGHTLGLMVFVAHGLYLLLYVRNWSAYVGFGLAGLLATLGLLVPWFTLYAGKYLFMTMAYQAQFYKHLADTNPLNNGFGVILPATMPNVFNAALPVVADLFWLTNGLASDTLGRRNVLIELAIGLLVLGLVLVAERQRRAGQTPYGQTPWWAKVGVPMLLLGVLLIVTIPNGQAMMLTALPLFGYVLYKAVQYFGQIQQRHFLVLMGLLLLTPTFFLLFIAFRNGHTYGITQRYTSFSFPYAVIIIGVLIDQLFRMDRYISYVLALVLLLKVYYIMDLNNRILADIAPKYTQFGVARIKNPYMTAADRIEQQYTPGDTVLYPAVRLHPADEIEKTFWPFSIKDAQMTNLYLPHDATYYQRMDTTQENQIWLVKGRTGQRVLIFDFKGPTYRY
ncbi:glycosyltransferase family 39 protein [Fibrella sp. HMF5335]|uniref:Glycosyltransferase family 39 protein n=1 Tax=Fibrella rubiginis TaxID=2817060 RepID=A0A939K0C7_9BACT|nr:glycosyltransferase family 39 protein [Fibrella rubiginis]MBO0935947.1 glycosyltransferase family 39 protein [Fibrella rubiginis]